MAPTCVVHECHPAVRELRGQGWLCGSCLNEILTAPPMPRRETPRACGCTSVRAVCPSGRRLASWTGRLETKAIALKGEPDEIQERAWRNYTSVVLALRGHLTGT
jgi:hypothetical protein